MEPGFRGSPRVLFLGVPLLARAHAATLRAVPLTLEIGDVLELIYIVCTVTNADWLEFALQI